MIAALVLAAQISAAPVAVTLDQLIAAPDKYASATVRLTGQVDSCWGMMCAVCPTEATPSTVKPDQCLAIAFVRDQPALAQPIRYADVALTARFDPTCLRSVCLDNGTVLADAMIEAVIRRRSSNEGLLYHPQPLRGAPASVAGPLLRLARADLPADEKAWPVRAFQTETEAKTAERDPDYLVCATLPGGDWPRSWDAAILKRSSIDPWHCRQVMRRDEAWVFRY